MSNNYISGIVQDSTGYIWIATHKGLNRFNGKNFESIFKNDPHSPLPDNLIVSMHHRSGREIIGATRAGGFAYEPGTNRFKKFIIPADSTIYFWANHAMDIIRDKTGNYIVSTKTGLYVFDTEAVLKRRFDYHLPADAGRVEMLFGGWLSSFTDGSTFQQNSLLGTLYDAGHNAVDTFYIRRNKYLERNMVNNLGETNISWCGKNGELLISNNTENSIDVMELCSTESIRSMMPFDMNAEIGLSSNLVFLNDSTAAVTCKNSGFYILHYHAGDKFLTCDGKKYFSGNYCTTLFKDNEGRLWIGTADGLYKENLHNSFFAVNDLSQQTPFVLEHEIRTVYAKGDIIFAGLQNNGGVLAINKSTGKIEKQILFTPGNIYDNSITDIIPFHPDTLWIATNKGIVWLNKNNYHYGHLVVPKELAWIQNTRTRYYFEDSKQNIWISLGTINSLVCYNRLTRKFTDISALRNPLLKITYVFSISEDLQGNIWLAGDGLCRWNVKKQMIDTLIPYPKVSKLLLNYMLILDRDRENNLWLSSFENEIIQFNCTTNKMYLRKQENNFLDGNTVTSSPIINDNIWLGTDNGISAFNIKNYSVKQFTYSDGLPSVAISSFRNGSYYDRTDNRFYIGAKHLLFSFVPDVSKSHNIAPELFIEKISVKDSVIIPDEREIRLEYYQNNITVAFNTINFTDPEENRYAWRSLNGADTSWNGLNDQTSITLTNLSGGSHNIQIKLFSINNHWPQQLKTLLIHIHPPFWKTAWFAVILALLFALITYLLYKKRISSVTKKERDKAQVQRLIAEEYKNRLELEQISNYFSFRMADKKNAEEVLWDVSKNLIGRMNYEECIIYMWNADKTKMIQKAAYGPKGSPNAIEMQFFDVSPGQGVVGHVMINKEPILVGDTSIDERYRVDDVRRNCELCVPVIHNNELIGIIDTEHSVANYFKERDIKILTTIATLLGNKLKQLESEELLEVKQKEIAFINQELAEAQLSALQTQMNPHFIFNSLNSIKGLILGNEQQKASRYLSKFANMIRMTLNQSKETFTTLYENLEHLESYMEMEKLRFDDSFNYKCTVDEHIEKEEIYVPTLMLQPLAENAIWHGLMHRKGEKKLNIHFSISANMICCSIEDNGIGIKQSEQLKHVSKSLHQSVGLTNLLNRIKILNEKYDAGCTLEITDLNDIDINKTGTRAVLCFKTITHKPFI